MLRSIRSSVAASLVLVGGLVMAFGACAEVASETAEPAGEDETRPGDSPDARVEVEAIPDDAAVDGAVDLPPAAPDACLGKKAVCPTTTTTAGSGLVPLDRCAFPIQEAASFKTLPPLVTALEKLAPHATTAAVLGDLNRVAVSTTVVPGAPAGVDIAFRWSQEDEDVTTWVPQGITGSADASATGLVDGRRVLLVSWYYTPPAGSSSYEKGVRVAFVDVTNRASPTYRFALLVEPKGTAQAPTFAPVVVHAGGLAWHGNLLYVPDTGRGFRVFDMARIMSVATDVDEIGCSVGTCRAGLYKYVIPQIGAYTDSSPCSVLFSYVSLDRSTTPPALVSGEYCGGTACASKPLAGRGFRWPLDPATGRLGAATSWPSEAFLLGQQQAQGIASRNGSTLISSSAPAGTGGALYRVKGTKSATSRWIDTPEDLMIDEKAGLVWSLSEGLSDRVVAGMRRTSYPDP